MELSKKIEEMEDIVQYASDEYFDYISALCSMYNYHRDMMSTGMCEALEKEVSEQYDYIKENVRLVEETYTHVTRQIEWIE